MYIMQDTEMFNFSLDSVLLPNFITINKNVKHILDIGCGNGPIPLILSTKTSAQIVGVEIQKDVFDLAQESIHLNNLENQITIVNGDINELCKDMATETYDIITCNPPFFKVEETSHLNKNDYKTLARHEIALNLEQIMNISRKLLKNNGIIGIVHRPKRLIEIIEAMKKCGIEPKKMQLVYPKRDKEANIVLIEGIKNGNIGLKILKPLYSHNEDGSYTDEIKQFFENR